MKNDNELFFSIKDRIIMYCRWKGRLPYILSIFTMIIVLTLPNVIYADRYRVYDYPMIFDRWKDLDPDQHIELYTDKTDADRLISPNATRIKFKFSKKIVVNSNLQIIEKSTGKIIAESSMGEKDLEATVNFSENSLSEGKRYVVDRKVGKYSRIQAEFRVSGGFVQEPILDPVLDTDLKVIGKGEADTFVHLRIGPEDYESAVNNEGNFTVELNRNYNEGTVITAFLIDKEGVESKRVEIMVQASSIAPPIIDPILYTDTIVTGSGTPNTKIIVTFDKTSTYESIVDSKGTYTILLNNSFPIGTKVEAYLQSTTVASVVSDRTYSEVLEKIITLGVNAIESFDNTVIGRSIPNAQIKVDIGNSIEESYSALADSRGHFTVSMNEHTYISGTKVSIKASVNNITLDQINTIVYPSKPTVEQPLEDDEVIKGKVDPGATIHVVIADSLYTEKANEKGEFIISVPALSKGTLVKLKQVSRNISSDFRTVEV